MMNNAEAVSVVLFVLATFAFVITLYFHYKKDQKNK